MSRLRCYDYVNQPFPRVAEIMRADVLGIFQRATHVARARAEVVSASLRATIGPIAVGTDVRIRVLEVSDGVTPSGAPMLRIQLAWEAVEASALFPSMLATLAVYPLTSTETQLDLDGEYKPPLGVVGSAVNALAGHRVAEAGVLRFTQDVAEHLRGLERR